MGEPAALILNHSTELDIFGCIRCVAGFIPILFAPGFVIAWSSDFAEFRQRSLAERAAWSVVLSLGVMGIVGTEFARQVSLDAVCWICCALFVATVMIASVEFRRRGVPLKVSRPVILIAALWMIFVVVELVDISYGRRLLFNVTLFDHSLRTAFVDAVMRTGVPPSNPLFWPGHAAPMRYYYFWYVLTAVAAKLSHATPKQALIASVVWSGFCMAAVLKLYCSAFLPPSKTDEATRWQPLKRFPLALGLLAVTGLDLLFVAWKALRRIPMDADMEWWSGDQVTSWLDSLLWVPHHIASLVCCALGFLVIWVAKNRTRKQQAGYAVIAGLSFASAVGLSVYVALAFASLLAAWIVWVLGWQHESKPRIPVLLKSGLVASLILLPFLRELAAGGESATGDGFPLRVKLRRTIDPGYLHAIPVVHRFATGHPNLEHALAVAALLPLGYLLEFGFYVLAPVIAMLYRRRGRTCEEDNTVLFFTFGGLFIATFVRSTVISNNDFGIRSVLVAQFFLVLLAVRWMEGAFGRPGPGLRMLAASMLLIGVAGSAYQAMELRLYIPIHAHQGQENLTGLAARGWLWHQGFETMDRKIPVNAVVQYNITQPSEDFLFAELQSVGRQVAVALPGCGVAFGAPAGECGPREEAVGKLFPPSGSISGQAARTLCKQLGIDYLIASRWDGPWMNPNSWAWKLPLTVGTDSVRVTDCK